MSLSTADLITFAAFLALVVVVSLVASRREESSEHYFLAGRTLPFWLIGFSLIASNISTEHFVGMAGAGFGAMGLAVASYEWIAALTLVFVAFVLLPRFLRSGIYTIPEFLEHRYGAAPRTLMAVYMLLMYTFVALASILYSGALGIATIFDIDLVYGVWLLGGLAAAYTIYGGLKAVVWSDLLQGAALLIGGAVVTWLALDAVGGVGAFWRSNADRLHLVLPADHPEIPWTALLLGIWIPNLFYWGLNQFITQRTLGAKNLAAGQLGIVFAAAIKLVIPFIIVLPGIAAIQLFGDRIQPDAAYPELIKTLLPAGLRGFLLAALFGAVMSSLDSMLNSAATLYTMDIHHRFLRRDTSAKGLVRVGRWTTAVLVVTACLMAPLLDHPRFGGIFKYIQMFQGFISPGIVVVFLFGLVVRRAPARAAVAALLLNIPVYGGLLWLLPEVAFLNHMAITALVLVAVMAALTVSAPLPERWSLPDAGTVDLTPSRLARPLALGVVVATLTLYLWLW